MKFQIPALDQALKNDLVHKINQKTKPLGALGQLEDLAIQIGLIQQTLTPQLQNPVVLVFAGDHGIAEAGVSPYPQAVTAQMVLNFLQGGAAINVFARQNGLALRVVDCGVNFVFETHDALIDAKIGMGTRNYHEVPAMSAMQCESAIEKGAEIARLQMSQGTNIIGFGEMGIGNTSSASCIFSLLCGVPIEACVGRGTGLDDAGLARKTAILASAIHKHDIDHTDAMQVLATFGGFEIAIMVGAMLQAAEKSCVLLIDGFITTAALLVASRVAPEILQYCIFAHCSNESGHQHLLKAMDAKPILNLGMRLGEGTGAALAYPFVTAAVNFLNEMASFESAHISQKSTP
jgi:nicotinate-nucleotide--dimethylbenzimidazole phosphoribosyltransferase